MNIVEPLLIAVGLSMDAFAVSVCTGLSLKQVRVRHALTVGLYFGLFQAAMPLIGWAVGVRFASLIEAFDHWIAFVLLALIGANMLRESFHADDCPTDDGASLSPKRMLPLAVATSIDALAVGVSFAFLQVDIVPAVSLIGVITFALSAAGVLLGRVFGARNKRWAERAGGVILILIGTKILLEHLGILNW